MTKYDLQTLLAVKPNAHIELDRFSDQAFTNNLVRSNVLSEQSVNRPRNVSGHSRRNVAAPLGLNMQNVSRQSSHSATPSNSQIDDAFVRFVEQHTSPKPQRVTAGGRIVPMNPWDSPPKWSLPLSSRGASAATSDASKTVPLVAKGETKSKSENRTKQQATNSSGSKVPKTAPLPADAANAPCFQPLASSSNQFQDGGASLASQHVQGVGLPTYAAGLGLSGDNNFLNAFAQPPTPAQMIGAQPSSFPFQSQQTPTATPTLPVWNSMNSITPATFAPYQPNYAPGPAGINPQWPQLPQLPSLPQVPVMPPLPQLPLFPQLPQLPQAAPTASRQATATNQLFVPSYFQDAIYHKSLEDATKQYDALSAQLSQIDRFTAMHAWVIDPETKKLLVEQRKSLVRELDTVRLYKEHLQLLFGKNQMKGTPGAQKETIRVPVTPSRNEAWDTPTKSKSRSLSPTVRNLYRTIEETDERGEPIDGLLRALSGASKVLAKKLGEERKRPLGVPAKEPPKELSDTFIKAKEEPAPEGPEKAEYAQPVQTSRKLWQSDPYPHSPLISQCFNKDWSPVLQKSAAPAVSQNVTAHAFLRSLDGAGKVTDDFELV